MEDDVDLRVQAPVDTGYMYAHSFDVWLADPAVLTDERRLVSIMRAAAAAGDAVVLGETSHTFPNGAVTAVLMLSQSHLCVHTWPEHSVANFDLITCGRLNGERILRHLEDALEPVRTNSQCVIRSLV